MAESKYGKYYITETPPNPRHPQSRIKGNPMPWVEQKTNEDSVPEVRYRDGCWAAGKVPYGYKIGCLQ